jgi:hypothetical protein
VRGRTFEDVFAQRERRVRTFNLGLAYALAQACDESQAAR